MLLCQCSVDCVTLSVSLCQLQCITSVDCRGWIGEIRIRQSWYGASLTPCFCVILDVTLYYAMYNSIQCGLQLVLYSTILGPPLNVNLRYFSDFPPFVQVENTPPRMTAQYMVPLASELLDHSKPHHIFPYHGYTLTSFSTPWHTLTHTVEDLLPIQRPLLKMTGSFLVTDSIWWHTADIFVIVSINHIMTKPFIISSTQWKPLIWWATVSGTKYSNRTRDCSINPSSLYQSGAHSGDIGDNFSKS